MTEEKKEETPSTAELMKMIQGLKTQTQAPAQAAVQQVAATGWEKPVTATANAEIKGVSIPISLQIDSGKIRVYLQFDASVAASPEVLMATIEGLAAKGLPLDVWRPKNNDWKNKKGGW
jgi:hypothetical protein